MNRHLAIKTSCFCVVYTDVGEGREQGCGSFVKLLNSPAIKCVSRLEPEYFNQQSVRPRLAQSFLNFVLIICVFLEEVFSSRALSLRHGFRARGVGEFGAFYPDFQDFQVN